MKVGSVSKSYAHALYLLGKEQGIDVTKDLICVNKAINASNDLENVLFMERFTVDEKSLVMADIMKRLKVLPLVQNFIFFLIQEKRMHLFPTIFKDLVMLDDEEKGFLRGTLEGAEENIEKAVLKKIISYLEKKLGKKTKLDYKQQLDMVAGLRATVGDFQIDASCDYQLERFKKHVLTG